ncbi:MAG TPA: ankyrin repeat domain-containing protein [Candidatus Dormibacteraeota bacterium]
MVEIVDIAPGLWIWRMEHPGWKPGDDWQPVVTCTCVESGGEVLLLDPLWPPDHAAEVWSRFDRRRPTAAVVIKPDHVRDIDRFVERFQIPAFGPRVFFPDDVPRTTLEPVRAGYDLPGGVVAQYDGRDGTETPLWFPLQRTVVFADALTERDGRLRVWSSLWHEQHALPALRELLALPFERVIISHGAPVHDRAAFERALELPPWPCSPLHIAAWAGSLTMVRKLVDGGADLNARDEERHATPLEWAKNAKREAVVAYLEKIAGGVRPGI